MLVDRVIVLTNGAIMRRRNKVRTRPPRLSSPLVDWAPAVVAVLGYGLARLGFAASVVWRDGWPTSAPGWSGAISGVAAFSQSVAVAVLLPAARRRRPVIAGMVAATGVSTALADAAMWTTFGGLGDPAGYAWPLVLATVLAATARILCRWGISSIWSPAGYDLPRITRVVVRIGAVSAAVAAGAAAGALVVQQPAALDRLLRLMAVTGLAYAVSATVVAVLTALERSRTARQARVAEMYQRLSEPQETNDR